jgi:hypothetical protein
MKKRVIGISLLVVLIIVVLVISILSNKTTTNNNKSESIVNNLKDKNIITTSSTTDKLYSEDFATLVKNSDAVIKGKVSSVEYLAINGNAWTKVIIKVDDVFKGDIKSGDKVEVYYLGGYISLEDHIKYYNDSDKFTDATVSNTVLKEIVDGEENFVEKDEELVLCLVKTSDNSSLPKDSYERLYSSGMLKKQDNKYVQLYGESKTKYSISKDNLSKIKELS